MVAIAVESGVALPAPKSGPKYPWSSMVVGDSFVVQGGNSRRWTAQCAVRGKKDGRRYSVRKLGAAEFRIFRIA